jgi:hypothetical protein
MPRRLSDPEWSAFLRDVKVSDLGLPPWGGIVEWAGQYILVYIGPERTQDLCASTAQDSEAPYPITCEHEIFLTDVSDLSQSWRNQVRQAVYNEQMDVFWYELPQEIMHEIATRAAQAGQLLVSTAEIIGQTAGAATGPLLANLTLPLVAAAVVAVIVLAKR